MEGLPFALNWRGVGDAAALEERNFVFVVGGVEYRCCRFQAHLVSGLVRRLLASDPSISRICLGVRDDEGHFHDIVNLMNGQEISITPANAPFLQACARELENDDLLGRIGSFQLDHEDVSMANVVDRIRIKRGRQSDCQSELDFLASHFFEVELDVLRRLSVSDLELVLTNPLLEIESEDQLYDAIISLAGENGGDGALALLRHVKFAFLNESKLSEFLDRIFPCLTDVSVWRSLCECVRGLCRSGSKAALWNPKRYHIPTFTSDRGAFNGIVQYLRDECGGNPHEKGAMSITASNAGPYHRLVDYGWSSWVATNNQPNSWFQFDFKARRVCLSHYSVKSDGEVTYHPLYWVLEVSDDGATWETVDERKTQDLNGKFIVKTYECNKRSDRFVRFVRLRQTGPNSHNENHLLLSEIEFFGKLEK